MNKDTEQTHFEQVQTATEDAIKHSEDISARVRNITIEALSKHHLDFNHIKSVINAVLAGAQKSTGRDTDSMRDVLKEVTEGLDDALAKSAYASKLAIEETAGRIKDFTENDLKRAMNDLADLEDMFIESLNEVANNSKTVASDMLKEISNHFKNSGTAVGQSANEEIAYLSKQIEKTGKQNLTAVNEASRIFAEDIARAASGFLAGIADSIKESNKED